MILNQQIVLQNQHQAVLDHQYELENQLVKLKQQVNSQAKALEIIQSRYQQEKSANDQLETQVMNAKGELDTAKKLAEEAERALEIEQQKRDELLGISTNKAPSSSASSNSNTPIVSSLPELTRAQSSFSGGSSLIMSPPPINVETVLDPFAGFKKSQQAITSPQITKNTTLSPVQAKAVAKYGFDLTAFDALSAKDDSNSVQKSSINDDLAAIFGSPSPSTTSAAITTTALSNFDSIFM